MATQYMSTNLFNFNRQLSQTQPGLLVDYYDKRKWISFLIVDSQNIIVETKYVDLDTAKKWLNDEEKNDEEKSEINLTELNKQRIRLQLRYRDLFEGEHPTKDEIEDWFRQFIFDKDSLTEKQIVGLKNCLHMDDSSYVTDWLVSNSLEHRRIATEKLSRSETGSFIFRKSSVINSDIVKARAITHKINNISSDNYLILHIYGFGYVLPSSVTSGDYLPKVGEKMMSYYDCAPCLIDILEKMTRLDLKKIIV
jgi:hypothetical protein